MKSITKLLFLTLSITVFISCSQSDDVMPSMVKEEGLKASDLILGIIMN